LITNIYPLKGVKLIDISLGDMTRYRFVIYQCSPTDVAVMGLDTVKFRGYTYHLASIQSFLEDTKDLENRNVVASHYFMLYVTQEAHSGCDVSTAIAMCKAVEALGFFKKKEETSFPFIPQSTLGPLEVENPKKEERK
jgi:hypothetical protein